MPAPSRRALCRGRSILDDRRNQHRLQESFAAIFDDRDRREDRGEEQDHQDRAGEEILHVPAAGQTPSLRKLWPIPPPIRSQKTIGVANAPMMRLRWRRNRTSSRRQRENAGRSMFIVALSWYAWLGICHAVYDSVGRSFRIAYSLLQSPRHVVSRASSDLAWILSGRADRRCGDQRAEARKPGAPRPEAGWWAWCSRA